MSGAVSTFVEAPQETVWTLITDVTRMGEWSPETHRAEWLGDATGPVVGARFRGHNRRPFLQRWSTRPRVRVSDPPSAFAFALGIGNHDFVVWRYDLDRRPGGTLVTESFTVRGWALYGLLRPRRRERQLVDGMCTTLDRLRRVAEATA